MSLRYSDRELIRHMTNRNEHYYLVIPGNIGDLMQFFVTISTYTPI